MTATLHGKRVTVCGLGLFGGGVGCVRWLVERGTRVTVTDLRTPDELAPSIAELEGLDVRFVLGRHELADFTEVDLVVANPAVPPNSRYLTAARSATVPITSEIALGLQATHARWIGVTGTQGKSSTVAFTESACRSLAARVLRAGNLGGSLVARAGELSRDDLLVLELSSYQLEALAADAERERLPPASAVVVTNVGADHLERHGTQQRYAHVKRSIIDLADPAAPVFLPASGNASEFTTDGRPRVSFAVEGEAAELHIAAGRFVDGSTELGRTIDFRPAGRFQRTNALIALGVAHRLGARPGDLAQAVATFDAPPHRLERLTDLEGHAVWDNGVSTTPESTLAAVESIARPCVLLCGGRAKDLSWAELATALAQRGDRVVAFGAARARIATELEPFDLRVQSAASLEDAFALACEWQDASETLLFSPACASFDAYRNFEDRAQAFRQAHASHSARPPE